MSRTRAGADPQAYRMLIDREQLPLPYNSYDEDNEIYHMDDNGLSIIFDCRAYGGLNAEAGLNAAMGCLPEGATMQFLLVPSQDITRQVDLWKKGKTHTGEIFELTRDNYARFLESKTSEVVSPNMRTLVCDYRLIVAVSIGGRASEYSVFSSFFSMFNSEKRQRDVEERERYKYNFKLLIDVKNRMRAALNTANLFPQSMKPDALIRFLFAMLNPNHDFRKIPSWHGNDGISDQMIANDTVFEIASDHIRYDGKYARSMSVKDYAYEWHCGMSDHLIGNPFGIQTMESTVIMCLNILNVGKAGINKVKRKSSIILSQNLPDHMFPLLGMKKRDLAMANKELERGKAIFHVNMALMTVADDYDSLNNVCGQIQAYYQQLGFLLEEDRYINLPILLSMLPGNYDARMKEDLARGIVVFLENAVDLAPTSADWGGNTARPELFFLTPRGQLFNCDYFVSDTNYNVFVIGTSGSGKSVAMQYIAMNYIMSGGKVSIIDIGGSYINFCNILGGQYIDIKPDDPICLNPWTGLTTEEMFFEYAEFLADWYWMMGSPADYKLAEEQKKYVKSFINKALELSYKKYGTSSSVDTVIECMKIVSFNEEKNKIDDRCDDFIHVMSMYSSAGMYGAFFNGESQIELSSDLVVLETGSMENIAELRDPILMILTYHISKSIYLATDMSVKNVVIIDEAHKFIGNHRVDGFIEQAYRRFRKHGATMIIGTQGWEDLQDPSGKSRAGRVIIDNSAFQIFMAQSPASCEKLKNSTSHNFNAYEKSMIDSISPVKGEYSEALLIHQKIKVKIRIVLDDWMKRIFFTTPDMRTYIRMRTAEGMSFKEAIESMPKEMVR